MTDESIAQNISDSNLIGMEFLITDVRMALTLLDLAETTNQPADRVRRIREAKDADDTVLLLFGQLSPTAEQATCSVANCLFLRLD